MSIDVEAARTQMVKQQVRAWDVLDPVVLAVLTTVPREQFVPPPLRRLAFADTAIPTRDGQVMLTPQVEGRLLQALQIRGTDHVLEVGAGTGFLTASLARLSEQVTSLELHAGLANEARRNLREIATWNAEVHCEDVFQHRPALLYDVIAVTGSIPSLDPRFAGWLAPGGRLFVIVGKAPCMRARLIERRSPDESNDSVLFETDVPPLQNALAPSRFSF